MVSTLVDSQFLLGLRDRKLSIKVELNHFNVNFILTYNIYVVKWNYFTTIFLILLSFFSKGGSLGVLPLGEKGRKDHSLPLLHAHSGIYHFSSLLSKLLSVFCGWQEETEILISRLLSNMIGMYVAAYVWTSAKNEGNTINSLDCRDCWDVKFVSLLVRVCNRESLFSSYVCNLFLL